MQSFCLPLWCAAGGLPLPGAAIHFFVGAVCGLPVLYPTGKRSRVLLGWGVVRGCVEGAVFLSVAAKKC